MVLDFPVVRCPKKEVEVLQYFTTENFWIVC